MLSKCITGPGWMFACMSVCACARVYICVCLFDKDVRVMECPAPFTSTSRFLRSCLLCSAEPFAEQTRATTNNEKTVVCWSDFTRKNHGWNGLKLWDAFSPAEEWIHCQLSLEGLVPRWPWWQKFPLAEHAFYSNTSSMQLAFGRAFTHLHISLFLSQIPYIQKFRMSVQFAPDLPNRISKKLSFWAFCLLAFSL